jgi:hypothetical protein
LPNGNLNFQVAHLRVVARRCLSGSRRMLLSFFLVWTGAWLVTLGGCGGTGDQPRKLQHVVIIFQENRTPDNLFHGLPNADIADSGVNSHGETIPLAPISLAAPYDLDHSHAGFLAYYDHGKMDGADTRAVGCVKGAVHCPPPNPQFVYVPEEEVEPTSTWRNNTLSPIVCFRPTRSRASPRINSLFLELLHPGRPATCLLQRTRFGGAVLLNINFSNSGCAAPRGLAVSLIDPSGNESSRMFTCFDHPTLPDLLDAKHFSWQYYSVGGAFWNELWNAPSATRHLRFGPNWSNVMAQNTQVFKDIATGQLPAVSWVIPDGRSSVHPEANDGSGSSWVVAIVNAIGTSPYWSNTTIFITWDDWGGFYDHVAPPIYNPYEYGFRVPLIVVSQYTKQGYISHVAMISAASSGSSNRHSACRHSDTRTRVPTIYPIASISLSSHSNFILLRHR